MTDPLRFFHYRGVLTCDGSVVLEGYEFPCGKPAVSGSVDEEGDAWYPTCVHHTRKATAVSIRELLFEAWREGHQAAPDTTNPYGGTR